MDELVKTFTCMYDSKDYISFDPHGGTMGIDIFERVGGTENNVAVILDKRQVIELIDFLQSNVDSLTD